MGEYNINEVDNYEVKQEHGTISGAIVCGSIAAVAAAAIWALITVSLEKQWVWMAIGAGVAVGYAIKIWAKRESISYGIVGAVFTLVACILGDFFTNVGFIASEESLGFFETLGSLDPAYYVEIAFIQFDFFSFIMYAVGAYVAFGLAKNPAVEKEQ